MQLTPAAILQAVSGGIKLDSQRFRAQFSASFG